MNSRRAAVAESVEEHEAYLQIGEVAERTGVTQRTLRFYEEKGLLTPPSRLEGGFRLYSEDDIRRVEQIKKLQTLLNLSLAEIKEMVEAEEVKSQIRAEYRPDAAVAERRGKLRQAVEVTRRQTEIIDQKLAALTEMKSHLDERLGKIEGWLEQLEQEAAKRK